MPQDPPFLSASQFQELWTSHRQLTRRTIDAFPEESLFSFSVGGMRTAADLIHELLQLGAPVVQGVATGEWAEFVSQNPHQDKASLLSAWDSDLELITRVLPRITAEQYEAEHTTFGVFTTSGTNQLLYALENEIHHRGQMYVYLRALGVTPPPFYQRLVAKTD